MVGDVIGASNHPKNMRFDVKTAIGIYVRHPTRSAQADRRQAGPVRVVAVVVVVVAAGVVASVTQTA